MYSVSLHVQLELVHTGNTPRVHSTFTKYNVLQYTCTVSIKVQDIQFFTEDTPRVHSTYTKYNERTVHLYSIGPSTDYTGIHRGHS